MKILLYFFLYFSLVYPSSQNQEKKTDWTSLDKAVSNVLALIANDEMTKAYDEIKKIEKREDNLFAAHYCLKAALYYKITEEYQTRDFEEEFEQSVEKAIEILSKDDRDEELGDTYKAKRLQFLGSAYGYRGMFRTLRGQWASAFLDGRRAHDVLEESLALDERLIDNKAGIGTYLYWRSARAGIVKYLLFWGDRRNDGIERIQEAIENASVVKLWAMGGMLRIHMEERQGRLSIEMADRILEKVPRDTGVLRKKAYVSERRNDKKEAIETYKQLIKLFMENDGISIGGKKLSTTNAQVDSIYNMLRLSKEIGEEVERDRYVKKVEKLKSNITPSFSNIESMVQSVLTDRY